MQCNAHAIANAKRISDAMFLDGGERRQFKDPGEMKESGGIPNVCAEGANNSCENHPLRSVPSLLIFDSKICPHSPHHLRECRLYWKEAQPYTPYNATPATHPYNT